MKQSKSTAKGSRRDRGKVGAGKRSLYRPELGASNYRRAQDGRFAAHPAFVACKKLWGVQIALGIASGNRMSKLRMAALANQMNKAMRLIQNEAQGLKSVSDKLRFAEAIAACLDPSGGDNKMLRLCWRAIERRGKSPTLSQAELRRLLETDEEITWSDEEWKRVLKRSGLKWGFPTHREKIQGGRLRKV